MNRIRFLLLFVAIVAAWSAPGFARQTVVGAAPTPVDATGVTQGVDMTGQGGGGTLTVGTQDIFTDNNPLGTVIGLAISTDAASLSDIDFNGNSTVYGDVGTAGLFFNNIDVANGATVNFLGFVHATTLNVGTGAVNFNSGGSPTANTTATNFTGDGTISLAPNTMLIGALTTNTANTGTLELGGGSTLDGAVGGANGLKAINVVGGSNTAGVSATITGAANAYSFSLGTNTLNVSGALTINNPGPFTINTTLASATLFGHIVPGGAVTLASTLGVNVLVPSTSYIPVGTLFDIVQATSGTNGSIVTVTIQSPTNPLYTFSAVPLAGTLNGLVTIRLDSIPIQASLAPVPGAVAQPVAAVVAPILVAIPSPPPDLTTILTAINALTDPAAVVAAEAQLAPSTPAMAAPMVTFRGTRQFQDLYSSRMDDVLCGQVSHLDKEARRNCRESDARHSGWWLKGTAIFGNQGANSPYTEYDSSTFGTMIAYDVPVGDAPVGETRAGLGLGYARSRIDGKTFDADTDFDTYQATAYIGHERGPWFVQGNASFGWNDYSGDRHIVFPGVDRTASSDYNGQSYTGFVTAGHHFFAQNGVTVTPLASLQYTHLNLDSYTETGAGDVNLNVESQSYNFLESGLGVKVARGFSHHDGTYIPEIHAKWFHELVSPTLKNTASFVVPGSGSFTMPQMQTADDTFNVGIGLAFLSCACSAETWSLEGVYDYNWDNERYSSHQGMLKLTGRF